MLDCSEDRHVVLSCPDPVHEFHDGEVDESSDELSTTKDEDSDACEDYSVHDYPR